MLKILILRLVLLPLTVAANTAFLRKRDTVITTSQRISTYAASFGASNQLTTVNPGVTYWLSGGGTHNFFGNVFTNGAIVVSQTDYLVTNPAAGGQTADFVGHTTTNGNLNISSTGSISLNDYGSASAPTYDWYLRTFTNYGSLQYCGRGDTGGSTYQLYCDLDCFNYGTIDYGQYNDNIGASFAWRNAALTAPGATNTYNIYNYGAFRMTNVVFHNVQNIKGTGCLVIGQGGVLYLEDGTGYYQSYLSGAYLPALGGQSISMSGGNAVLHMDTQVYSHNSNFGAQVYGFGPGKAIEFYETIRTTSGFSYSSVTGILNVIFVSGNQVNINIGLGYTPTSFYSARNPQKYNTGGYNAIFYGDTVPTQVVPTTCQPALQTCTDPRQTAGVTPTYTTQTAAFTGTAASTATVVSAVGTTPGTIVVYTPASYVTQTTAYTGSVATTATVVQATGTAPGTVIVYYPASYITQTSTYTGTVPSTSTVAQATGTTPGTVVIYTPQVYVTVSTQYTGASQLTAPITSTIAPTGTSPGTVVIYTQAAFVTATSVYTGPGVISAATTSTIAPSGTAPGTILVITPAAYVTVTSQYTGGNFGVPITSTVAPSGTAPGTVVIYTPAVYVTTTVPYTGTGSISGPQTVTIPPSGTAPGTVQILTPTATRPASVTTNIGPNQCICTAA